MAENYIVINGKRSELTEEQLKQLGIEVPKANPFVRQEKGEKYYYISAFGDIQQMSEKDDFFNRYAFNTANYCTDKEIMEQRKLHEILSRLLWRYSMEHDGDKIDWSNREKQKFYIYYDCQDKSFKLSMRAESICVDAVHFYTKEVVKNAIEEIIKPFMAAHPEFKW